MEKYRHRIANATLKRNNKVGRIQLPYTKPYYIGTVTKAV
jgi:hypothetical protein